MLPSLQPKVLASAVYKEWYPFDKLFDDMRVAWHPTHLAHVDALLLWGGEDISPSLYKHHAPDGVRSGPEYPSNRDRVERDLALEAIRIGIPIIGVCRGAQMMCALSGGSLYQHVTNHAGHFHTLMRDDGTEIEANSLHHQMMNLEKVDHRLIAWVDPRLSKVYFGQDGQLEGPEREPEIAWIPKTKALCIQGHPEFMDRHNPFSKYCLDLVDQYVLSKIDKAEDGQPSR